MEAIFSSIPNYENSNLETWLMFASGQIPSKKEVSIASPPDSPPKAIIQNLQSINTLNKSNESPKSNLVSSIKRSQLTESPEGNSIKEQVASIQNLLANYQDMQQPDLKEEIGKRIVNILSQVSLMIERGEEISGQLDTINELVNIAKGFFKNGENVHLIGTVLRGYRIIKEKQIQLMKDKYESPKRIVANPKPLSKKIKAAKKKDDSENTKIMKSGWGVNMRTNTGNNVSRMNSVNAVSMMTVSYKNKITSKKM